MRIKLDTSGLFLPSLSLEEQLLYYIKKYNNMENCMATPNNKSLLYVYKNNINELYKLNNITPKKFEEMYNIILPELKNLQYD